LATAFILFETDHIIVYELSSSACGGRGPKLANGPDERTAREESERSVATRTVRMNDEVIVSAALAAPEVRPVTVTVSVTSGSENEPPYESGSVEKENEAMPRAPGATSANPGFVSRVKSTVVSDER
jgi:hypothetical protein